MITLASELQMPLQRPANHVARHWARWPVLLSYVAQCNDSLSVEMCCMNVNQQKPEVWTHMTGMNIQNNGQYHISNSFSLLST